MLFKRILIERMEKFWEEKRRKDKTNQLTNRFPAVHILGFLQYADNKGNPTSAFCLKWERIFIYVTKRRKIRGINEILYIYVETKLRLKRNISSC